MAGQHPAPPSQVHETIDLARSQVHGRRSRFASIARDEPNALPVIVYFHGGGWVFGDLEHSDGLCRLALAVETGCVVVNVDYRLAPENQYPAAAEDCYAVLAGRRSSRRVRRGPGLASRSPDRARAAISPRP